MFTFSSFFCSELDLKKMYHFEYLSLQHFAIQFYYLVKPSVIFTDDPLVVWNTCSVWEVFRFLLNLDVSFAGNQKTCLTEPTNERRNIPTYGFNFLLGKRVGDFVSGWSFLLKIFSVNFLSLKQENVLILLDERFTFVFSHRLDVRKKKYMELYQERWGGEFILSR